MAVQRLSVFILLVLFWGSAAAADKHFFWRVESDQATVYLLGSIHLGKPDLYPLPEVVEQAFAESSTLVLEIDPTAEAGLTEALLTRGTYPAEKTIRDAIEPATFQRLKGYLQQAGIPLGLVERMRAGLLGYTLVMGELVQAGYSPLYGIDLHFASRAEDKQILALESAGEQMQLLLDVPNEDAHIRQTLDDLETLEETMAGLEQAWREGDTQAIERLAITEPMQQHPAQQAYMERMFFERNLRMAEKIRGFLRGKGTWFVVVGAGHLVGERGIVGLLGKGPYHIEQL